MGEHRSSAFKILYCCSGRPMAALPTPGGGYVVLAVWAKLTYFSNLVIILKMLLSTVRQDSLKYTAFLYALLVFYGISWG